MCRPVEFLNIFELCHSNQQEFRFKHSKETGLYELTNLKSKKGLKASVGVSFSDILLNSVKLLSFLWFVFCFFYDDNSAI